MHFETVLKHLLQLFKKEKIEYALIGGVGLGVLGIQRATVDLDFMILVKDLDAIHQYMISHGYGCLNKGDEFSAYVSKNPILGRVDFMLANTPFGKKMLERALEKKFVGLDSMVKVVTPEDLIGLKLLAISNNSKRAEKDMMDIKEILYRFGKKLDYELIKGYAKLFGREEEVKAMLR